MKARLSSELEKILPGRVATDPTNRALYSRDMMTGATLELKAGDRPHLPDLVCWPETTREVSAVIRFAVRHRTPVIPFGGGSGVSGGVIPVRGGITIDLKRMNRIESIEEGDGATPSTAVIQTGILGEHLERGLNQKGWTLGHFPSSILCCTLGGALACRAAGQLSSKYGKIEDMVEAVEAVLASGEIVPLGRRIRRSPFSHVETKDLLVGAEGTLGVITKARMKIRPLPPSTQYRGLSFNSVTSALNSIRRIMQSGLRPSVVRLYDPLDSLLLQFGYERGDGLFDTLARKLLSRLPLPFRGMKRRGLEALLKAPGPLQALLEILPIDVILILAFEGEPSFACAQERIALAICQEEVCRDLGEKPGLHWLKHRYSVSFKMPQLFEQGFFVDTIEVAATWEGLPDLYERMRRSLMTKCLVMAHFSHAYPEGCSIYFTIVGRTGSPERDKALYHEIWEGAMEACLAAGGTVSHHHGIGLLKARYLPQELGEGGMALLKQIKKGLDPQGLMNPGKLGL